MELRRRPESSSGMPSRYFSRSQALPSGERDCWKPSQISRRASSASDIRTPVRKLGLATSRTRLRSRLKSGPETAMSVPPQVGGADADEAGGVLRGGGRPVPQGQRRVAGRGDAGGDDGLIRESRTHVARDAGGAVDDVGGDQPVGDALVPVE